MKCRWELLVLGSICLCLVGCAATSKQSSIRLPNQAIQPDQASRKNGSSFPEVLDLEWQSGSVFILAATEKGLFKSTDAGKTWNHVKDSPAPAMKVAQHPENPLIYYVATPDRVYRTINDGSHWEMTALILEDTGLHRVGAIKVIPTKPETVYLLQSGKAVFKSDDAGMTWKTIFPDKERSPQPRVLTIDPQHSSILYVGTYEFGSRNGGVFRSTDGGSSWNLLSLKVEEEGFLFEKGIATGKKIKTIHEAEIWDIVFGGSDRRDLFVVTDEAPSMFRRSRDDKSWSLLPGQSNSIKLPGERTPVSVPFKVKGLVVDSHRPRRFYGFGPFGGVIASEDGGNSWTGNRPSPIDDHGLKDTYLEGVEAFAMSRTVIFVSLRSREYEGVRLFRAEKNAADWREVFVH